MKSRIFLFQRAEHFIGRYMMKSEIIALSDREIAPIFQCNIQQAMGTHYVCLYEDTRAIDRTIDVAFRGEMHDGARLVSPEDFP